MSVGPRIRSSFVTCCGMLAIALAGGCASGGAAQEQHFATDIDPATTQPGYWEQQPAVATVSGTDFQQMWEACADAARDFLFRIDRQDFRNGILTTEPLVSGQWFEPWRRDARTVADRMESSAAAIRRTIQFQFERTGENSWTVTPKVIVERQSIAENRITSVVMYRNVFLPASRMRVRASGTAESDQGIVLPSRYWYPIERDSTFEAALARAVEQRLAGR